ncbi:MAG: LL-diaminopimelate aminotransferase [Candidatus Omnitrophota bacterium]|nr:LL-diaminopimelate aminotransferase [Candidatus Omnitrophota bacterium]
MNIEISDRLKQLPPYLFVELDRLKQKALSKGKDIIDLGIGDPDQATPKHIIKELQQAVNDPANHHYALDSGMFQLRESVAGWYNKRFNVNLDPDREILPLIGSKEGISHIPLGFINPGDVVLVPDPGYPPYTASAIFTGAEPVFLPLLEQNNFLPDLKNIGKDIINKAKMMFLNYPNNPTSAIATKEFFAMAVDFAGKNGIIICHDAAYSEIYFDGNKPVSFLEVPGAKDVGVEFHSLSKTYNMTGWRIGFVSGNQQIIKALRTVKSNIDSGIFQAVQLAGIKSLNGPQDSVEQMRRIYQERRDILINGLNSTGWSVLKPQATFYVWAHVLDGYSSSELSKIFLEKLGIVTTPGVGFGKSGEGYIRMALTVPKERIKEAVERIKGFKEYC